MDYFETMMSSKGCQQRRIMRHDISFFCIPGKMIVATTYSCVPGHFLRIPEPTLTIGESATFGMMMYLICVDQLPKIGHHGLVIKKREFFGYLALITTSTASMSWVSKLVQKRI
jgi:zinc transporter ZupT